MTAESIITGRVTDVSTGSPVTDAEITVQGATDGYTVTTRSDFDGQYRLDQLPSDTYSMKVTSTAYTLYLANNISVSPDASPLPFDVELHTGATVAGIVYDSSGLPLSGAAVVCLSETYSGFPATSESDGTFLLAGLYAGDYELWAYHPDLALPLPLALQLTENQSITGIELHLVDAGSVVGNVVSSTTGLAVEGVTAWLQGDPRFYVDNTPSAGGVFSIADAAPGTYSLIVSALGYADKTIDDVVVNAYETTTLNTTLDPLGEVGGSVLNTYTNNPLPGAMIDLWQGDSLVATVTTDDGGGYFIPCVAPGEYDVMIRGTAGVGQSGVRVTVPVGGKIAADLVVDVRSVIAGTVYGEDGETCVAGANVTLFSDDESITQMLTDARGWYSFYVSQSGTYDVVASSVTSSFPIQEHIVVDEGDMFQDVNFVAGVNEITVAALDNLTGQPLEDVAVLIEFLGPGESSFRVGYSTTNDVGLATYEFALPGTYRISAAADGYATLRHVITVDHAPLVVEYRLDTAAYLSGTVRNATDSSPLENVEVYAYLEGSDTLWRVASVENGDYAFSALPAGTYTVVAVHPGFERWSTTVSVDASGTTVDPAMNAATTSMNGTAVDDSGRGIARAWVTIYDDHDRFAGRAFTDDNGSFSVDTLAQGSFEVRIVSDGRAPSVFGPIALATGENLAIVDQVLPHVAIPARPYDDSVDDISPDRGGGSSGGGQTYQDGLDFDPPAPSPPSPTPTCDNCDAILVSMSPYLSNMDKYAELYGQAYSQYETEAPWLAFKARVYDTLAGYKWLKLAATPIPFLGSLWGYVISKGEKDIERIIAEQEGRPVVSEDGYQAEESLGLNLVVAGLKFDKDFGAAASETLLPISIVTNIADYVLTKAKVWGFEGQIKQLARDVNRQADQYDRNAEAFNRYAEAYNDCISGNPACTGREPISPADLLDRKRLRIYTSRTPEDKYGPAGYDAPETPEGSEARYIPADQTMDYKVEFWNKEDALVPTQYAIIEDVLDPSVFDLDTFEFTRIGFLKWDVALPGGQAIDTRIDCRPDMNLAVDVKGTFDADTGRVFWEFKCVDPETGDWPEDPFAGFLPPFDPETGYEIGWVDFRVGLKSGLATGTEIANQAFVEFDFAGDLYQHPAPKEGPWINTIDAGAPIEPSVDTLPAITHQTDFLVSWTAEDDPQGSGVATFDIYVAIDGGPFSLWLDDTSDISAVYPGEEDHNYAFYSVATDNVGNRELQPGGGDAQTFVDLLNVEITPIDPDPRNTSVETIVFTFESAVDGFDVSDLTLSLDGSLNLLDGTETLSSVDQVTWTLTLAGSHDRIGRRLYAHLAG